MRVAIIPARGGSKRVPRKNIRPFAGRPVIAHSIETARASGLFDEVIVSTDDDEIAEVAQSYRAAIPFRRPPDLAGDHATTIAVIQHALGWLAENGRDIDFACCIYATAPFLRAADLRYGLAKLVDSGRSFAFSVTAFEFPIQRALRIRPDGALDAFAPEHRDTRSQDLEPAYHDAGQFYWGRTAAFRDGRVLFSPESVPVILPRYLVHDIDTEEDWVRAELVYQTLRAAGLLDACA
ncbi:MAG TPA: pseudaminic acid cytidylyltransferase [Stellaceae bacterium]|jgi:N-acylneuraminate cytidylyltransferase